MFENEEHLKLDEETDEKIEQTIRRLRQKFQDVWAKIEKTHQSNGYTYMTITARESEILFNCVVLELKVDLEGHIELLNRDIELIQKLNHPLEIERGAIRLREEYERYLNLVQKLREVIKPILLLVKYDEKWRSY